jgi:hypothetical protein
METHSITDLDVGHLAANFFNDTGNLMPQCLGQRPHRRFPGTIMDVRMANTRCLHPHQNIPGSNNGHGYLFILQGSTYLHQLNSFHYLTS